MTVSKFRSLEDAENALRRRPLDAGNIGIACRLSARILRLARFRRRPGVFKYRSIEEADAARDADGA